MRAVTVLAAAVCCLLAVVPVQAATNYTDVDILNFALNLEVSQWLSYVRAPQ